LNSPADGYALFQGSPNELILAPLTNAAVKYKSEDFRLIQMIAVAPLAIMARKELPANTADELVEYAQKMSKENKPMNYANVGTGSFYHLMGEQLSKMIGAQMLHVPYKGAGPVLQDMLGNQVDIFMSPFGKPQIELAKQGKIKFIATMTPQRIEEIKHIPSVNESKSLKGFNYGI
jgi:tripartite-type tricarboxylate transporter receptor subunit TctC